jgi:hypothetical protein
MEAAIGQHKTIIRYPWDDYQLSFTCVPPHVAVLHEIRHASKVQKEMIDNLLKHLDGRLDGLVDLGNGGMSVTRLTALFNESTKGLQEKIDRLAGVSRLGAAEDQPAANLAANNQLDAFILHYYGGQYHRVPESWRFPNCGVFHAWRQWLVGDRVLNIPPLKVLKAHDVKHVDSIPLSEVELRGRAVTGRNANKRRPTRKTLNDFQFLMKHIEAKVKEAGKWTDIHSLENVDEMFQVVATMFGPKGTSHSARATQARWSTFLNQVRKKLQKEREEAEAKAAQEEEAAREAAQEEEESEEESEEEWDERMEESEESEETEQMEEMEEESEESE